MEQYDLIAPVTPRRSREQIVSLCLLVPLFYLTVGHAAGLPLPAALDQGAGMLVLALIQLVLTLSVCWLNRTVLQNGLREALRLRPGRCLTPALGAAVALVWGLVALVQLIAGLAGGTLPAGPAPCSIGFGSAGAILSLTGAGILWQDKLLGRAAEVLPRRLGCLPRTATVAREGKAVRVSADTLQPGDIFLVRPGSRFPADGVVLEGSSCVVEAPLTGEDTPVNKTVGDHVSAGTLNQTSALACQAERVGDGVNLARAVQLARHTVWHGGSLRRTADRYCGLLTLAVLGVALVTLVVWLLAGQPVSAALTRAVCVLAVGCPGALCLAVPAVLLTAGREGLDHGVLFYRTDALETIGAVNTMVLDKTGTVTTGAPGVVEVVGTRNVPAKFLLGLAAGLEAGSDDPLAKAVLRKARADGVRYRPAADLQAMPGGVMGKVAGKIMAGGTEEFIRSQCDLTEDLAQAGRRLVASGATPLYFSLDRHAAGVIGVADAVRPSSKDAIAALHALGIRVVLMTGDDPASAARIAGLVGLQEADVLYGVQPDTRLAELRSLRAMGTVAMVSEPCPDAAPLDSADIGVAVGAGQGLDASPAPVVLLRGDLTGLPAAVQLSRRTSDALRRSLMWTGVWHLVCLVLAAVCPLPGPVLATAVAGASCAGLLSKLLPAAGARTTPDPEEDRDGNAPEAK